LQRPKKPSITSTIYDYDFDNLIFFRHTKWLMSQGSSVNFLPDMGEASREALAEGEDEVSCYQGCGYANETVWRCHELQVRSMVAE
jgi:hypothetical protein